MCGGKFEPSGSFFTLVLREGFESGKKSRVYFRVLFKD